MVEYLEERGADMEVKGDVSDPIIWYESIHPSPMNITVNMSGWIHSDDMCFVERSFISGWISGGERGWYGNKGQGNWCYHLIWNHTFMNISVWTYSLDICCKERSFISGCIFVEERGWYGGKNSSKWCHDLIWNRSYVIDRHTTLVRRTDRVHYI